MRFELTPEIVDQIIFAMENQETPFVFDSETLTVTEQSGEGEPKGEAARFILIPQWSSADGFQLMERFVATLRNPLVREKLRTALSSGKGVFRNFKNALKDHGEIERLWFAFKDREMKARVIDWYNELCDMWGWEHLRLEPEDEEETEELVLSDFEFSEEDDHVAELVRAHDREAWNEARPALPSALVDELYRTARAGRDPSSEDSLILSARTPSGDLAGFVWGVIERLDAASGAREENLTLLRVLQLFVASEYRGLGIAKALIDGLCRTSHFQGIDRLLIDLPESAEVLLETLEAEGFSTVSRVVMLDLEKWGRNNTES